MDTVVFGARRMSTMTSEQAQAVERWLDDQPAQDGRKGKEVAVRPVLPPLEVTRSRKFDPRSLLRVASMNLSAAIIGFNIVMSVLVKSSPKGLSILDINLNWIISIPVAGSAFLWELSRFILLWRRPWGKKDLLFDIVIEAVLGVVSAICAILAAFQAAQHRAYNAKNPETRYQDVGLEIALCVLLGFLMISSFGIKAVSLMKFNRMKTTPLPRGRQVLKVEV